MTNEEIKEENVQKTIEAGMRCFVENGIANTQIGAIAERAGLSKRSFMRYFGSKDNFVFAVLKSINIKCYQKGRAAYQEITAQYSAALDRLRALMTVTRDYFSAHPDVFILMSEGQTYVARSPEKEAVLSQYMQLRNYWPSVILSLMKQGAEEGSITCFAEDYIQTNESNALWYAYLGLMVQLAYANSLGNYPMEDCVETITRFMEQSLQSLN